MNFQNFGFFNVYLFSIAYNYKSIEFSNFMAKRRKVSVLLRFLNNVNKKNFLDNVYWKNINFFKIWAIKIFYYISRNNKNSLKNVLEWQDEHFCLNNLLKSIMYF